MRRISGGVRRVSIAFAFHTVAALWCGCVHAQILVHFDLPVQPLAQSLKAIGTATNTDVGFNASQVAGFIAPALKADLTLDGALLRVLGGTGLRSQYLDDHTIVIAAMESSVSGTTELRLLPAKTFALAAEDDQIPAPQHSVQSDFAGTPSTPSTRKTDLEEIVVTGSHIRGISSSSPVITIDRTEIDSGGFTTTSELFEALPQNAGSGINERTTPIPGSNNISYASSVNLRGLGSSATLVLLDGHRLASNGFGGSVDIGTIPLSAISRVDVLTDGASAVYGADAVGGVVNFITDKSFTGLKTDLQYGSDARGDNLNEIRASQVAGANWKTGDANATFEYYDRGTLQSQDRSIFSSVLPPGETILPKEHRLSFLASLDQQMAANVTAQLGTLYSEQVKSTSFALENYGDHFDISQLSVNAGLKVGLPDDWVLNLSTVYGRSNVKREVFTDPGYRQDLANDFYDVEVSADGSLFSIPSGDVRTAIGGVGRREDFSYPGVGGVNGVHREIRSAYAEISIPLVPTNDNRAFLTQADLDIAGRYDSYTDFGSSSNPKIGLSIVATPGFKVRATWGKSFHAPEFYDLNAPNYIYIADLADPKSQTGTTRSMLIGGGNPALAPETAKLLTAGFDLELQKIAGFRSSLTYYDVKYDNRIGGPVSNAFDALLQEAQAGPSVVQRNPSASALTNALAMAGPSVYSLVGPYSLDQIKVLAKLYEFNLAETRQRGTDLTLNQKWHAGRTDLGATANLAYVFTNTQRVTPFVPTSQLRNTVFNTPAFKFRLGVDAAHAWAHAAVFLNRISPYDDTTIVPAGRVSAYTTIDTMLQAKFGRDASAVFLNGLSLSLSVRNLFNTQPPRLAGVSGFALEQSYGYDPANASPIGRFITARLVKQW